MTTLSLPVSRPRRLRKAGLEFLGLVKKHTRPAVNHIKEYGYTMAAGIFFSAAGFVHSPFTGLIVTGVSFLALEWRVRG